MSFQIFTDHSNYTKSRRALFISSVLVIISGDLNFLNEKAEILGLEIGVSKIKMVIYLYVIHLYFLYVYCARLPGEFSLLNQTRIKERLERQSSELSQLLTSYFRGIAFAAYSAVHDRERGALRRELNVYQTALQDLSKKREPDVGDDTFQKEIRLISEGEKYSNFVADQLRSDFLNYINRGSFFVRWEFISIDVAPVLVVSVWAFVVFYLEFIAN